MSLLLAIQSSGQVTNNLVLQWETLEVVQNSSSVSWNNLTSVSDSALLEYNVRSAETNNINLSWNTLQSSSNNNNITYDVTSNTSNNSDLQWNILNSVGSTQTLLYNLSSAVSNITTQSWNISNSSGNSLVTSWHSGGGVNSDVYCSWNLSGSVFSVQNNLNVYWDTVSTTNCYKSLDYNILGYSQLQFPVSWDLQQQISGNLTINYSVLNAVSSSVVIPYSTLVSDSISAQLAWSVENVVYNGCAINWDVRAIAPVSPSIIVIKVRQEDRIVPVVPNSKIIVVQPCDSQVIKKFIEIKNQNRIAKV